MDGAGRPYGTTAGLADISRGLFSGLARRNLAFNEQFELSGPINGQGLPPVRDMRYGVVDVARAGCGVIAVYNALLLLGNPHPFPDVIAWGDRKAAAAFGLLGTLPWKAKGLFRRLGCTVATVTDKALFDRRAREADVCLFTYWNKKGSIRQGMHTVCLQYRSGGMDVYNLSNYRAEVSRKPSLEEWAAGGIGPVVLYCVRKQEGVAPGPQAAPKRRLRDYGRG